MTDPKLQALLDSGLRIKYGWRPRRPSEDSFDEDDRRDVQRFRNDSARPTDPPAAGNGDEAGSDLPTNDARYAR